MQEEIATTLEATSPTIARAVRADTTSISPIEAAASGTGRSSTSCRAVGVTRSGGSWGSRTPVVRSSS